MTLPLPPDRASPAARRNDQVERVYALLANIYDVMYGLTLRQGRVEAVKRMRLERGRTLLEVGVGTALSASLYPPGVHVVGVDLSAAMLKKARIRIAAASSRRLTLCRADASVLPFRDGTFDVAYAPYVMTAVPDPVQVAREMRRVIRPDGQLVFLNHFRSRRGSVRRFERLISPLTRHLGFTWELDLDRLVAAAGLEPVLVEDVNVPSLSKLVICNVA